MSKTLSLIKKKLKDHSGYSTKALKIRKKKLNEKKLQKYNTMHKTSIKLDIFSSKQSNTGFQIFFTNKFNL